jgi:putative intracellular protease/amidase
MIQALVLVAFMLFSPLIEAKKILVIVSSAENLPLKNSKIIKVGTYFNELVVPLKKLIDNKYDIDFATPNGEKPKLDEQSLLSKYFENDEVYQAYDKFFKENIQIKFDKPLSFSQVIKRGMKDYSGLLIPGGHAPMVDLILDKNLKVIFKHFHAGYKPTALICHGPISLLSASDIYKGYKVTVFSDEEEKSVVKNRFKEELLFYPEDTMKKRGFNVVTGTPGSTVVVKHKEVITAQNPKSDELFAEVFYDSLVEYDSLHQ